MSGTRAVFFDAGHTLLKAHPDLGSVYADVTAGMGASIPPERFAAAFVPVFRGFVREYATQSTASDAQDYAMWREITRRIHASMPELAPVGFEAWFDALYRRFGEPEAWRCYDDVASVLAELRSRGLRLGIVSNWDTRLRGICAGLGVDRQVDFIVISAEVGVRKPDPRIFREALLRAGVAPDQAVHVGDVREEDVEGAARAGIRAYLLDRRGGAAGGDVIASLSDLPRLV